MKRDTNALGRNLNVITLAALASIAFAYFFLATLGLMDFSRPDIAMNGYYERLAKAFLHGRTYVIESPGTGDDYWDYWRYWDFSIYKGKNYLYFGPAPAIVLYLPIYFLTLGKIWLKDWLATLILCLAIVCLHFRIAALVREKLFPDTPDWMFCFCLLILAFCNGSPTLLSNPRIYEVSIASGLLFFTAAFWKFTEKLLKPEETNDKALAWISLYLGLAIGSRASYLLPSLLVLGFSYWAFLRRQISARRLALLGLPFLACLSALAAYNHVRFGSMTEFGWHYQRSAFDQSHVPLFSLDRILPGLYFELIHAPHWKSSFPFLYVTDKPAIANLPSPYQIESPLGILFSTPFVLLSLLFPWIKIESRELKVLLLLLYSGGILSLFLICMFPAAINRYRADYAGYLLFIGMFAWMSAHKRIPMRLKWQRNILFMAAMALGIWSCYMGIFVAPTLHPFG